MADRPVVLVHGYSDSGTKFDRWREIIEGWGRPATSIHVGNYVTLSNEVTLKDVAEGFDRALDHAKDLAGSEFDAIVHSTGMLVLRAWLCHHAEAKDRRRNLKHLVALAPATNGSPLAHRGRSWLGAVFKGNKTPGPDFMEAGNEVLYGLELASRFTWDLAHQDMFDDNGPFKPGTVRPYVFTFCGTRDYGWVKRRALNEPGTDGTVRWAGCALNSRKVSINLMVEPGSTGDPRVEETEWTNQNQPLILVGGLNHSTIMTKPSPLLQELVRSALEVSDDDQLETWNREALASTRDARKSVDPWQQFVIRVVDERGDPVPDWHAELFGQHQARDPIREFAVDVHPFKRDTSLRCFHVNLKDLQPKKLSQLHLRVLASSGTRLVAYHGAGSERITPQGHAMSNDGIWDARISLTPILDDDEFRFFYPFTTTFVEIMLNREPMPMLDRNDVFWF